MTTPVKMNRDGVIAMLESGARTTGTSIAGMSLEDILANSATADLFSEVMENMGKGWLMVDGELWQVDLEVVEQECQNKIDGISNSLLAAAAMV